MKRAIIGIGLVAAMMAPWQTAMAQASGQTAVSIDFPNIVILHYFANLTLSFTGDSDTDVSEGNESLSAALASPASFGGSIDGTVGGPAIPASISVTVTDAWAVRGISTDGDITVAASIDTADATNGTSTATMSALQVSSGGSTGVSIDVNSPGFVTPVKGDILFELDISGVDTAATHTGMLYTITASAP